MGGHDKGRANYSDKGGGAWMSQGWVSLVISKLTGEMTGQAETVRMETGVKMLLTLWHRHGGPGEGRYSPKFPLVTEVDTVGPAHHNFP